MDGIVKENGNSGGGIDSQQHSIKVSAQSVIQSTQQHSVIQTTSSNLQQQPSVLTKGNVILVSKQNSVIQTPQGSLQTLQVVVEPPVTDDEDSLSPRTLFSKKRRSILGISPSRIKMESNDLCTKIMDSSGSEDCDSNLDSELSSHSLSMSNHYHHGGGLTSGGESMQLSSHNNNSLQSITMTTAGGGNSSSGTILHYTGQDGQYYVPGDMVVMSGGSGSESSNIVLSPEDQVKKRELRLLKNREAARECRRKKKEYIKCLENRVAVLETQNKALIDELKSLKELYCSKIE